MPRKKRNTNSIDVPLYGEQATIMRDWLTTDKHCIDIVPVGSGKTFLASVALPLFASDERYHKGKDIIYSAPTGSMIKSLIWEPLKQSCIEHFGLRDGKEINNLSGSNLAFWRSRWCFDCDQSQNRQRSLQKS